MTSFVFYGLMFISMMVMLVKANLSPSNPEPGTVWTTGKEYEITWEEDNTEPTINAMWKNFRIDLMTGEDLNQVLVTNIAENVKGDALKYKYIVPDVTPHAPIYFLMFSSDSGEDAWSSRFSIVDQDGKQEVPEKSAQPNGEKIPWGIGELVTGNNTASSLSSSSSSVSADNMKNDASASLSQQASKSASPSGKQSNTSASPSNSASVHKGHAKSEEKKHMSDATIRSTNPYIMVGAFVSSIVGLFLI